MSPEQEVIFELETATRRVEERLELLPRHRLDHLRKTCGMVIEKKYAPHRLRKPLYGNLPRVFNPYQLGRFFRELYRYRNAAVYDDHCLMFFYALRVGEVSRVSLLQGQQLVRVVNEKCGRVDYLPLIKGTEPLFERLQRRRAHSKEYVAKYFRETCDRLGDEFMYRYASDRKGRQRRQFSTHCLRKTAGNLLRSMTGDPYKEACYLRHNTRAAFGVTAHYMHYSLEEMREDLNNCLAFFVERLVR